MWLLMPFIRTTGCCSDGSPAGHTSHRRSGIQTWQSSPYIAVSASSSSSCCCRLSDHNTQRGWTGQKAPAAHPYLSHTHTHTCTYSSPATPCPRFRPVQHASQHQPTPWRLGHHPTLTTRCLYKRFLHVQEVCNSHKRFLPWYSASSIGGTEVLRSQTPARLLASSSATVCRAARARTTARQRVVSSKLSIVDEARRSA